MSGPSHGDHAVLQLVGDESSLIESYEMSFAFHISGYEYAWKNNIPSNYVEVNVYEDGRRCGTKTALIHFIGEYDECAKKLSLLANSRQTGDYGELTKKYEVLETTLAQLQAENVDIRDTLAYIRSKVITERNNVVLLDIPGKYQLMVTEDDLETTLFGTDISGFELLVAIAAKSINLEKKTWKMCTKKEQEIIEQLMIFFVKAKIDLEDSMPDPPERPLKRLKPSTSSNQLDNTASTSEGVATNENQNPKKKRATKNSKGSTNKTERYNDLYSNFKKKLTNDIARSS